MGGSHCIVHIVVPRPSVNQQSYAPDIERNPSTPLAERQLVGAEDSLFEVDAKGDQSVPGRCKAPV